MNGKRSLIEIGLGYSDILIISQTDNQTIIVPQIPFNKSITQLIIV